MKQYSFYNVELNISGEIVDGYSASNSIITAGRFSSQHARIIGARGEMVVATSADRSGYIGFSLLQTSDSNAMLRRWTKDNQAVGLTTTAFQPLQATVSDLTGRDKVIAEDGMIPKQPSLVRGIGINDLKWLIEFGSVEFFEGDQPEIS